MKTRTILCAALAIVLLCGVLTACGMKDDRSTTTTSTTTNRADNTDRVTDNNSFSEMMRNDAETVSEMFSEGASELRDSSFLDPQNGIISDTQPNP